MIDTFKAGFNKDGKGLHDALIQNVKEAVQLGQSEYLFQDQMEEKIVDKTSGIPFYVHYYNPKKYIGPAPAPVKTNTDPLSPPYNRKGTVIHLTGGPGHYVLPNKDLFKFGHLVLSSDNPDNDQGEELDDQDFHCFADIFAEFGEHGIGYYNSSVAAGCSQLHKHIQFIPFEDHPLLQAIIDGHKMPFQVYKRSLEWFNFDSIKDAYRDMLAEAKTFKYSKDMKAYNFILSKKTAFLFPRSQGKHPWNLTINSLGVSGHLMIWETSDPRIKQNPLKVITDVCLPNENL